MIEEFLRPDSLEEALQYRKSNKKSFWFGGGTDINHGQSASGQAISLELLKLDTITLHDDFLRIGSMVSIQNLIDSDSVPPVLREASGFISSRNIRNIATVGGNIAVKSGDSTLIPILLALDSQVETADNNCLFLETYLTEKYDDLIISVQIPIQKQIARVRKISRTSSSSSIVNTATVLSYNDDFSSLKSAAVVLNGISGCFTRLNKIEAALLSGEHMERDVLQKKVAESLEPKDDYRCTSEYKVYIASVLIADSVMEGLESLESRL